MGAAVMWGNISLMDDQIEIGDVRSDADLDSVRELFREYERWLDLDLCFQGFEDELRFLPGKYLAPEGRLFLVRVGEDPAGCVAFRKLDEGVCEMKRLYVRPAFRGLHLGKRLVEMTIAAARESGYKVLLLDTYPPKMEKAVRMYRSIGFREVNAYYENPHSETLYMALDL